MGQVCGKFSGRVDGSDTAAAPPVITVTSPGAERAAEPAPGGTQSVPVLHAARAGTLDEPSVPELAHEAAFAQVPLTGRKRSLLVGINYCGTQHELHGCVSDVRRMLASIENLGFERTSEDQVVLVDAPGSPPAIKPTRANLKKCMQWLVEGAQPGDSLFFHYSGLGAQEPMEGCNDCHHEALVPSDFEASGVILDTELFDILVKPLPSGCRLTCIFDSCHTAGVLNLPFRCLGTDEDCERRQMVLCKSWARSVPQWRQDHKLEMDKDSGAMGLGFWMLRQEALASDATAGADEDAGLCVAEVVVITGCSPDVAEDSQRFRFEPIGGDSRGHFVIDSQRIGSARSSAGCSLAAAFVESIENSPSCSYLELLSQIRQYLAKKGSSQVAQVVTSLAVDLTRDFALNAAFIPCGIRVPVPFHKAMNSVLSPRKGGQVTSSPRKAPAVASSSPDVAGADAALAMFVSSLAAHERGASMLRGSSRDTARRATY